MGMNVQLHKTIENIKTERDEFIVLRIEKKNHEFEIFGILI